MTTTLPYRSKTSMSARFVFIYKCFLILVCEIKVLVMHRWSRLCAMRSIKLKRSAVFVEFCLSPFHSMDGSPPTLYFAADTYLPLSNLIVYALHIVPQLTGVAGILETDFVNRFLHVNFPRCISKLVVKMEGDSAMCSSDKLSEWGVPGDAILICEVAFASLGNFFLNLASHPRPN